MKALKNIEKLNDSLVKAYGKNIKAVWAVPSPRRISYCVLIDNLQLPPDKSQFEFDIARIKEKSCADVDLETYYLTDFFKGLTSNNLGLLEKVRNASIIYDPESFLSPLKSMIGNGSILGSQESVIKTLDSVKERFKSIENYKKQMLHNSYRAVLDAAGAAMIARNYSIPTPKDMPKCLKNYFVKKKILEKSYIAIFENIMKKYKNFEQGMLSNISGRELHLIHSSAVSFVERMKTLVGRGFSGADVKI